MQPSQPEPSLSNPWPQVLDAMHMLTQQQDTGDAAAQAYVNAETKDKFGAMEAYKRYKDSLKERNSPYKDASLAMSQILGGQ